MPSIPGAEELYNAAAKNPAKIKDLPDPKVRGGLLANKIYQKTNTQNGGKIKCRHLWEYARRLFVGRRRLLFVFESDGGSFHSLP